MMQSNQDDIDDYTKAILKGLGRDCYRKHIDYLVAMDRKKLWEMMARDLKRCYWKESDASHGRLVCDRTERPG